MLMVSRIVSFSIIYSRLEYKRAFVRSLYMESLTYPNKYKELYRFDLSVEIAKNNAWLEQKNYQRKTFLKIWVPDLSNEILYTR